MALDVQYEPDYASRGELQRSAGSATAKRENLRDSMRMQLQADSQNAQNAIARSSLQLRAQEAAANLADRERQRNADIQRMGYAAELQQQMRHQQNIDEENRQVSYLQQQQLGALEREFDYTPEQQVELKKVQDSLSEIDSKESSGELDGEQAAFMRHQANRKRVAIRPSAPKRQPLDNFQDIDVPGMGTYKFMPEGYRGGPALFNPATGMFRHEEIEAEKIKADREHDLALATLKAGDPEAVKAEQAAKEFEVKERTRLDEAKLFATLSAQFMTEKVKDLEGAESLAFGDEKTALEKAKSVFKALEELKAGAGGQQGSDANQNIVSVATPEEAMRLPSGTLFRTPDGRTKRRP